MAAEDRLRAIHGPDDHREVYSPHEVPPGINMALEDWAALSDVQREMIGNRRFARPVEGGDGG